jgi:diguanylate cyclase (GGDEF)-like protein
VSVLAFDLDKFKSINDTHGHKSGDAVLTLFAKTARKTMRGDDIVGRIGGEEFLAVLSGTLAEASIAAERVRAAFQAAAVGPDSPQIPATVSIGVASGAPTVSIDVLITRADAMLYHAKANGRNRVELDEEFVSAAEERPAGNASHERVEVRADLRAAAAGMKPVPALAVPIMLR